MSDGGVWRTINGARVFIRDGNDLKSAIAEKLEAQAKGNARVDFRADGGIMGMSDGDAVKIQQVRDEILSDRISKDLNEIHQNRHIKDSKHYIDGRSVFDGTLEDAQELINTHHGTGEIRLTEVGEWIGKEFITLDRDIGRYINPHTEENYKTNSFSIHYSKMGAHIVPARRR